ncbi:MAG: hypothetical protein RR961_08890 [Eubacterium sp.]
MSEKVKCTKCNYTMNITIKDNAECHGVFLYCKGRHCRKEFELKIKEGKQIK